ncbi:hypothetical protein [Sphingomonas dokdonensis]|uniref:Uncharacterized protein n=1 Tax=Sphingomonas dokdonensis TaxID=344880 RepID=A0A245ZWH2_9SPHN|nr:hypothetical protein [Sphingomonas dokdonensis]OWK34093.1 hypothetical protein SPDO_09840 [Sphingomonas dokdonensis]
MNAAQSAASAMAGSANGKARLSHSASAHRSGTQLLVAEMLLAWVMWRAGEPVSAIATRLGRHSKAARSILFGDAA